MRTRKKMIQDFVEEVRKIMEKNLYGLILYGNPEGEDLNLCIISNNPNPRERCMLRNLKEEMESRYSVKLDVLYFSPDVFSEALSRVSFHFGRDGVLEQLRILHSSAGFYQLLISSLHTPIAKPLLNLEQYKL